MLPDLQHLNIVIIQVIDEGITLLAIAALYIITYDVLSKIPGFKERSYVTYFKQ